MSLFNTYVKLGDRGNSLLSFNLSGCTTSNKNSCTVLSNYQNVPHDSFNGNGLYVTGLTLYSINYIYVEADRVVSGSCDPKPFQMIPINGLPATPTPSPTSTPTPTPTPTSTPIPPTPTSTTVPPTPTPTPTLNCVFDVVANIVTPTPTPTSTTPPPTPTSTPISIWYQLTNCSDSSIAYSEEYPEGQFAINEKVTSPGKVWEITGVNTTTNPGGTLYAIISTGFMGCGGVATFSISTISASRSGSAGTTTQTSGTTITVTYDTVTIKLSTWVETGYGADTTIDVNGSSISPDFAGQGASPLSGVGVGNASYTTFTLPVGVYNVTDWNVSAISDSNTTTVVQAKLEQV
jgi:hypothetical protein